ncbi:WD40 repeat domain-containing protein [Candidatus Poribacteria bacterium]|nr:WD40 repeat domain-containing protein [Candidatus Poribacteria bacterium]MYH81181.1 WD40 repeat domain-containing protein [Candidatus Poribacteria bacterium]MYK95649.1 WD40 repeat domain-containing protein [Candidatus Poribacteria bacterium]
MKKPKLLYIVCLLISCLLLSNSFAQEYASQWHLPEGAKARLGRGKLNNIIFSPDGTRVAVPTSIGIWVYNAHTTEAVSLFSGIQTGEKEKFLPTRPPEALTFSADAILIASAHGNSIYVWDTATGTAFALLDEHPDVIKGIALSPDSTKLATAAGDWTVRLWEVGTGKYLNSLTGHAGAVNAVAFSPDGKILASAGIALRLWNADTGELLHADDTDLGSATQLVFSPDGKTLASGGGLDRMVHLWDVKTGTLLKSLEGLDRGIREIVFSPDSDTLVTVSAGSMRIWDVRTGTEQKSLPTLIDKQPQHIPPILKIKQLNQLVLPRHRDDVYSARFSKDGEQLVSASSDGSLHVWDVETGLYQQSLALGAPTDLVSVLTFSEDSKYLASGDKFEERIRVWDAENATQDAILTPGQGDPLNPIRDLTVSPGIKKLAGSSLQGTIQVWDAATLEQLSIVPTGRIIRLLPLVFSPDGKFLTGSSGENLISNKIELWQTDFGDHLFTLEGHTHRVSAYIFSPDSKILASGGDDAAIVLWDVKTGNQLANLTGHTKSISALTFSPDGKTLASGANDEIRLWDVNTGTLMSNLDAALNVAALAFSPDGKTLVGASGHMIILWKLETIFQPHAVLRGHQGTIYVLMFSPDGKTLASGGADGTILLWDMEQ